MSIVCSSKGSAKTLALTSNLLHPKSTGLGRIYIIVELVASIDPPEANYLLTLVGVSRITKDEALNLVNQTYRLPGDEDHFVVHLDVFHQLHCLVCRSNFSVNLFLIFFSSEYVEKVSSSGLLQRGDAYGSSTPGPLRREHQAIVDVLSRYHTSCLAMGGQGTGGSNHGEHYSRMQELRQNSGMGNRTSTRPCIEFHGVPLIG